MRLRGTLPVVLGLFVVSLLQLLPAQDRDNAPQHSSELQSVMYNQEQQLAKAEQQKNREFFNQTLDDRLIFVAFTPVHHGQ